MHKKTKLGVLASGKGTNLEAILKACKGKDYPAYVGVVISDQKEAPALQKATAQDVPGIFIDPKLYETREAFDQMLTLTLKQYQVDLVVLAGFMRILSPVFIHAFPKKAINILDSTPFKMRSKQEKKRQGARYILSMKASTPAPSLRKQKFLF